MKKFGKIMMGVGLSLCLATTGLALTGCKKDEQPANMSITDVFAMGMVSASNYLGNNAGEGMSLSATVSDGEKSTIREYAKMFEGLLQDGIHPSKTENTDQANFKGYANKLTLTLGADTYTMYYNEVAEGSETELDEDEIETETTSFLSGKIVMASEDGAETYYVVGSREIESEIKKDVTEVENELKLIFSANDSLASISDVTAFEGFNPSTLEGSYVVIEQESEEGEIEFRYTTKNASGVKSVEIEFENEDGHEELEIEIEENGAKVEYEIVKVEDNKYAIRLKADGHKTVLYLDAQTWEFSDATNAGK